MYFYNIYKQNVSFSSKLVFSKTFVIFIWNRHYVGSLTLVSLILAIKQMENASNVGIFCLLYQSLYRYALIFTDCSKHSHNTWCIKENYEFGKTCQTIRIYSILPPIFIIDHESKKWFQPYLNYLDFIYLFIHLLSHYVIIANFEIHVTTAQ